MGESVMESFSVPLPSVTLFSFSHAENKKIINPAIDKSKLSFLIIIQSFWLNICDIYTSKTVNKGKGLERIQ
jgi:hypothetical protein